MNLFQIGDFTLHSGAKSRYKIDCDALTNNDWDALALMLMEIYHPKFNKVIGIPTGGLKFAKALEKYRTIGIAVTTLIVDDVLTTGGSMKRMRAATLGFTIGAVVFSRGKHPSWIHPLFSM